MPDTPDPIPVLITVRLTDEIVDSFLDVSDRVEILYYPIGKTQDVPDEVWAKAEVLYTLTRVPEPALAPNLRWIHTHSAGVDHLLERPIFHSESMQLTTSSGIHTTTMAEYAFMMILTFGHRLLTMIEYKAEALWPVEPALSALLPLQLRGSTIGVVGYGSIGREIARIAHTLGMEVLAVKHDVRQPANSDQYVLPDTGDPKGIYFHRLYPPEALISMVRDCDFVVLTVPLTDATRMMVSTKVFEAMKEAAYLINVSRGGIVDETALLYALQNGQIAGAALDVFETEPLPAGNALWRQPNLIISPHVAGNTDDYQEKAASLFIENLKRYIARKDLLNVVDLTRGY